jgi:hypothetical protein
LFVECPVIRCFWIQIEIAFFEITGNISDDEKMLGRVGSDLKDPNLSAVNRVILFTCQSIHKSNIENKLPTTKEVALNLIQLYYKENVYFSTKSNKKWDLFYNIWTNLSSCINRIIPFSISNGIPKSILSPRLQEQYKNFQEFLELSEEFKINSDF